MKANEILGQDIPEHLSLEPLNLTQTNLSRISLTTEKREGEKLVGENTNTVATSNLSFILAPFILLIMGGIVIFHKLKLSHQPENINNLDDFPCTNCHFFSKNSYLKCAVNPSIFFTKAAISCCDYQPLQNITKIKSSKISQRK
ncbi:hypothetical protein H6G97_32095 [Nostoc flagelliforme FACHB-838]|uniref:Uncharacterized protein n=1 Tax=Nostoc flagelliforme FACHB-838 TaxID=2692904 RepID=A0ABR8E009_9NOSO|nr:hypothetical protein [Nostoc flagelliforme]MBD2533938.1 hypothetical protein [Nostoc flagelliforme FACHB-838]